MKSEFLAELPSSLAVKDFGSPRGHGIVAETNLPAGRKVLSKHPTVMVPNSDARNTTCARCLQTVSASGPGIAPATVESVFPCEDCGVTFYCSKSCEIIDRKRFHQEECQILQKLTPRIPPTLVVLVMRLLILEGTHADDLFGLKSPLLSHLDKKFETEEYASIALMAKGAKEFSGTKLPLEGVIEIVGKTIINAVTVVNPLFDSVGLMIDGLIAMFNHSCNPNAFFIFEKGKITVRTGRKIAQGEEICVSYIDNTLALPNRLKTLSQRYFFICSCESCLPPTGLDTPDYRNDFVCAKCGSALHPYRSQDVLSPGFYNNYKSCPNCGIVFGNQPRTIEAIDNRISALKLHDSSPIMTTADADKLLAKLALVRDLKVVPLHRSPFTTSIQRLLTFHVSQESLAIALKLIGIEYFYQDPVLWPALEMQAVRLAHMARFSIVLLLVMLDPTSPQSQELASDLPTIDLGVCLWGLLDVMDRLIPRVYGENSQFQAYLKEQKSRFLSFIGDDYQGRFTSQTLEQLRWNAEMDKIRKFSITWWENL
ncbi:hypothetical protein BZA70DRAFT_279644 [Myxozyma melibiosi]|uniref:Suppressor of anucleate metulae protein B n=1 Tax=Myxozyma melibiosi TaxID=54550 RepID=A0ABR1F495_9ASCO